MKAVLSLALLGFTAVKHVILTNFRSLLLRSALEVTQTFLQATQLGNKL